jgi:hypothetical protein
MRSLRSIFWAVWFLVSFASASCGCLLFSAADLFASSAFSAALLAAVQMLLPVL